MKKILLPILALCVVISLIACGIKKNDDVINEQGVVNEGVQEDVQQEEEIEKEEDKEEVKEETKEEVVEKPVEEETEKEEEKAEETVKEPEKIEETFGNTLLSDFKDKATDEISAEKLAVELLENPIIEFEGGITSVEEGLLTGFDNEEIKGFKEGAMFSPMISSIPFVGYVFELENASETDSFIKLLEKNANLRWNLCVEADEMITGSKGNKVFFVMCPKNAQAE